MPDLQIDQAIRIRNPIYLNDASSFRLFMFYNDQNSHPNIKLQNLSGSTMMGRLYGRPCSTTTSTAPWTSSSTPLTNRCHSVVLLISKGTPTSTMYSTTNHWLRLIWKVCTLGFESFDYTSSELWLSWMPEVRSLFRLCHIYWSPELQILVLLITRVRKILPVQ